VVVVPRELCFVDPKSADSRASLLFFLSRFGLCNAHRHGMKLLKLQSERIFLVYLRCVEMMGGVGENAE
jgi:hypothetical protein